ncbi:MAG TPA: bifunctional diguanylate cyclase/phosphodiesterase [Solirubrobacteraceae bacterium]|nr:bifunctional diguanylate cyclase/phosphodiesterase [Solirubrobacteraceae bacterium]
MTGIDVSTPRSLSALPKLRSHIPSDEAPGPSRRAVLTTAGFLTAAGLSLWLAQTDPEVGDAVNALTLLAIAALLVKGPRRQDPLRITRWLLLSALGAALCSSLMLVGYGLATGHPPPRPWAGDAVDLLYVPLAVFGLILIPAAQKGAEPRGRAAADGLLAATATWYFVAGAATQHVGLHFGVSGIGRAVALAYAAGDVGILATALTVLSRCGPQLSRFVGGIACGLVLIAVGDLVDLVSPTSPYAFGPVLLLQGGLLLLLLAAAIPSPRTDTASRRARLNRLFETAPFLPLGAGIVMTSGMVLDGRGMPQSQVLPALLVALALVGRQYANAREKQRLLERLRRREVSLEAALREDSLTGMGNRLALMERLDSALGDPRQWPVMVAVLDLDDFKLINDSYGHSVGDEVLRQAARRVASTVRAEDLVVRLGGDEFAIIATGIEPGYRNAVARRLLSAFDAALEVQRGQFRVSPSVGIVIGQPPQSAEELLAHADAAMYKAKEDGRGGGHGTVSVLDEIERRQVIHHMRIRHEVAEPDLDQFHVVYQPVVELSTQQILGFEALLRWEHPELGTVSPALFIPMAEQAGSISVLGRFVLGRALHDLARLQWRHRQRQLFVGVNVSPRQLDEPGFTEATPRLLEQNGLGTGQLMLEITEHAVARNLEAVEAAASRLRAAGIAIAVDDFGMGYSALHYLERLAPNAIKLDRSFLADQSRGGGSHRLLSALITMASGLGLRLVAEGIETEEELALLMRAGCEIGQGYLFSRPVPLEQVEQLLDDFAEPEVPAPTPEAHSGGH